MSRYSVPPSPIGVNLHVWANNLVEYLNDALGDSSENLPNTVLLPHLMGAYRQSAAQDGILMYDPTIEAPTFSKNNDWWSLLAADSNGDATISGQLTVSGLPSNTTASAANMFVDSNGLLYKSTSSGQYKSNYRPIGSPENIIEKLNPIRYHSELDGRDFIGFEMENVGAAMPEAAYDGNYDVRAIVAVVVDVLKNMLVKEAMK